VNQGSTLLSGEAGVGTWVRVAVNYLLPFLVASAGYLSARRRLTPPAHEPDRPDRPET
jgi:hypothetical protein